MIESVLVVGDPEAAPPSCARRYLYPMLPVQSRSHTTNLSKTHFNIILLCSVWQILS